MVKILSRSGASLADIYDVEGSIAGIDQLNSRELNIFHEMGGTVMSERLGGQILRTTTGALPQTVPWDLAITGISPTIVRVLGAMVFTDDVSRLNHVTLSLHSVEDDRDIPIWIWDANEESVSGRLADGGAAATVTFLASPLNTQGFPSMMFGADQSRDIEEIAFRGTPSTFGAGTVEVTALIYIALARNTSISSYGLPIPGW